MNSGIEKQNPIDGEIHSQSSQQNYQTKPEMIFGFNQRERQNLGFNQKMSRVYVNSLYYRKTKSYAVEPKVYEDEAPAINLYNPNLGVVTRVLPGEQVQINTHIIFNFPPNKFGFLVDKPSIVTKKKLKLVSHVIYREYQGEIIVILQNLSKNPVEIFPGEVIAQMILQVSCIPILFEERNVESDMNCYNEKCEKPSRVEKDNQRNNLEKDEFIGNASLYRLF